MYKEKKTLSVIHGFPSHEEDKIKNVIYKDLKMTYMII